MPTVTNDNNVAHRPVARGDRKDKAARPQHALRAPGQVSEIPLPLLIGRLREDYTGDLPKYRRTHIDAMEGLFPAERRNGRWYAADQNLPAIAKAYGLTPRKN
jgi:hypothetical protein